MRRTLQTLSPCLLALSLVLASACSDAEGGSYPDGEIGGDGSLDPSVGQGGSQDFGQFRQILLDGGCPGPETIDDVGFFNEHKIDLPDASCGEDVCIHGFMGVMGNMISGSNCTLLLVGMNTPIDPAELERPPLNLAIAVDTSGSMAGSSMDAAKDGLMRMLDELEPEDRITLVRFSEEAEVLVEAEAGDAPALVAAIAGLEADGGTNIYDGLREAMEVVAFEAQPDRQNRVILVSDGVATDGITSQGQIVDLASSYAAESIGLTTIGMGSEFDVELMRSLAEQGAGAFYFLEDPEAVREVFVEEVQAFLVPLARDAEISIDIQSGYDLRAVYGTTSFEIEGNRATIDMPTLQIAHRLTDDDAEAGRRGGGGAIVVEMLPTGEDPEHVGTIDFDYLEAQGLEPVAQQIKIDSPLEPWETPSDGYFSGDAAEKAFVMLNIYVGFEMAASRVSTGQDAEALGVLEALGGAVEAWLAEHPDEDIEDDLFFLQLFVENIRTKSSAPNAPQQVPPNPPDPWPQD